MMRYLHKLALLIRQMIVLVVDYVHHVEEKYIPERWRRTYRFAVSGLPSQVIYYSIYIILPIAGVHYLISAAVAFVCYLMINFMLMRRWVFGSTGHPLRERLGHFALHTSNQSVSMIGLYGLVTVMKWNYIIAQIPMTAQYFCINLILSKYIFDPRD